MHPRRNTRHFTQTCEAFQEIVNQRKGRGLRLSARGWVQPGRNQAGEFDENEPMLSHAYWMFNRARQMLNRVQRAFD